jgi:hypothetical protein
MADSERKIKMISLRISEEEFGWLKTRHNAYGARTASDLARIALQRMMTCPPGQSEEFAQKLAELDERVHALESHLFAKGTAAVNS